MAEKPLILLVEDNPDDEQLALMALQRSHVSNEVHVARDGIATLDFLASRAHADLPVVVLLDLKLPRLDGLEVLRRIRTDPKTCLLPVVILTSSDEEQDIISSYQNGANSYVRKTVDFDRFIEATRQLGLYWLLVNTPPPLAGIPGKRNK